MEKKHSFAILSFVRVFNRFKDGEASVYLRISVDGKRTEISTKTTVPIEKWMPGKGRVKGIGEAVKKMNVGIISFELFSDWPVIFSPKGFCSVSFAIYILLVNQMVSL